MVLRIALFGLLLTGCAIGHPCIDGGDVTFPGSTVDGDKRCMQKEFDGKQLNDGPYVRYYKNGKQGIVGNFKEGYKEGLWSLYDSKGNLTQVKYFERGVERPPSPQTLKYIDQLIEKNNIGSPK